MQHNIDCDMDEDCSCGAKCAYCRDTGEAGEPGSSSMTCSCQHPTQLEARYLGVGSRRTFELHATSKRTVEVRGGTIGKFCLRTGRGIDNLSDWLLTRKSHTFARWCAERDGHAPLPSNRYGEEPLPKATKEPAPVKVDHRQLGMFGEEPR